MQLLLFGFFPVSMKAKARTTIKHRLPGSSCECMQDHTWLQAVKETKTHVYTYNESSWVTDTLTLRWVVLCAVNSTQRGGGWNKNQPILREIPALKWVTHLNWSKITDIKEWPGIHKVPSGFFFWDILCSTPLCLRGLRLTVSLHEVFPKKKVAL